MRTDITEDLAAFREGIDKYFSSCDNAGTSPACMSCKEADGEKCVTCKKRRVPYTLSGLCLSLGITKRQFENLKANKCFQEVIDMALLKIESYIEENSFCGNINGTLATAVLKENFGWGKEENVSNVVIELSGEADIYGG